MTDELSPPGRYDSSSTAPQLDVRLHYVQEDIDITLRDDMTIIASQTHLALAREVTEQTKVTVRHETYRLAIVFAGVVVGVGIMVALCFLVEVNVLKAVAWPIAVTVAVLGGGAAIDRIVKAIKK